MSTSAPQYKNKVEPIVFAEAIKMITITASASNNLISDWISKYNIHPEFVKVSKETMENNPTRRQLQRAKPYQRRNQ
jgi:hypothetical protein